MQTTLRRIFPHTDRTSLSDWCRYIICRIRGHHIIVEDWFHWCDRCGDAIPTGDPRSP